MLTESQLIERQSGLGGSDMAAILGLDPYKQAIDIFYTKRPDLIEPHGYIEQVVSGDPVDFGSFVEPAIAELYAKKTGNQVRNKHQAAVHKTHPFMRANIDRKIVGVRKALECKSANWRLAHQWGEDGSDEIAEHYLPQVHHYMLVLDYPTIDVAVLIGGASDFRIYTAERDPEWDDMLLDSGSSFWKLVEAGEPPGIDYEHKAATDVIKRVYTGIEGKAVLSDEALHIHLALKAISEQRRDYEKTEEVLKNHIAALIGNAGIGVIPGIPGAYVRKKQTRKEHLVSASEFITCRYSSRIKP